MNIQPLEGVVDHDKNLVALFLPHGLFLKPYGRIVLTVSLPKLASGETVSNWDLMERLRSMIKPNRFSALKVSKSTIDYIRFDAEIDGDATVTKTVLEQLDRRNIRLPSLKDLLEVRSAAARDSCPTRNDWEQYFQDSRDSDAKVPGYRPDTVYLSNLPIRWFRPRHQVNDDDALPSESIFKRIFEKFGPIRAVDIPICDPYRKNMKSYISGVKMPVFDNDTFFEGYVQFEEYAGFYATMRALRNHKLIHKDDKYYGVQFTVDFDRERHLSDAIIQRRTAVRDRCIAKEAARLDEERKQKEAEAKRLEEERIKAEEQKQQELNQQLERENKRKEKQLQKLRNKELIDMSSKMRAETKALALAQRKLESVRVLRALFERIELKATHLSGGIKAENGGSSATRPRKPIDPKTVEHRQAVRQKCLRRYGDEYRNRKEALEVARSTGIFRAVLKTDSRKRSPSQSSVSSDDAGASSDAASARKKKKRAAQKRPDGWSPNTSGNAAPSLSSGLSEEEVETKPMALLPHPPGPFPVFNPETGQWMNVPGMGMFNPFGNPFMGQRPADYFANPLNAFNRGGMAGFRGGARGGARNAATGGASAPFSRGGRGGMPSSDRHALSGRGARFGGRCETVYNHGWHNNSNADDRGEHQHHRDQRDRRSDGDRRRDSAGVRGDRRGRTRLPNRRSSRSRSRPRDGKLASTLRTSSDRWSSRSRSPSRSKGRRSWSRRSSSASSSSSGSSRSSASSRSSRSRSRSVRHRRSAKQTATRPRNHHRSSRSRSRPRSPGRNVRRSVSRRRSRSPRNGSAPPKAAVVGPRTPDGDPGDKRRHAERSPERRRRSESRRTGGKSTSERSAGIVANGVQEPQAAEPNDKAEGKDSLQRRRRSSASPRPSAEPKKPHREARSNGTTTTTSGDREEGQKTSSDHHRQRRSRSPEHRGRKASKSDRRRTSVTAE